MKQSLVRVALVVREHYETSVTGSFDKRTFNMFIIMELLFIINMERI